MTSQTSSFIVGQPSGPPGRCWSGAGGWEENCRGGRRCGVRNETATWFPSDRDDGDRCVTVGAGARFVGLPTPFADSESERTPPVFRTTRRRAVRFLATTAVGAVALGLAVPTGAAAAGNAPDPQWGANQPRPTFTESPTDGNPDGPAPDASAPTVSGAEASAAVAQDERR